MYSELLDHFVGKVCTIFTLEMNRDFKTEDPKSYPQPLYTYFLGRVEAIDDIGILIRQPNGNLRSFFFWPNVVSISEEEELNPENEEDAKTIESLKQATRVEDIKFLHPAFRLQLDRTSKQKKLFSDTLKIFEEKQIANPFD